MHANEKTVDTHSGILIPVDVFIGMQNRARYSAWHVKRAWSICENIFALRLLYLGVVPEVYESIRRKFEERERWIFNRRDGPLLSLAFPYFSIVLHNIPPMQRDSYISREYARKLRDRRVDRDSTKIAPLILSSLSHFYLIFIKFVIYLHPSLLHFCKYHFVKTVIKSDILISISFTWI